MISKPVQDIRFADLNALIGTVPEGRTIEYKRQMPAGTRDEKIKFLAAVSSLANTAGGDLLIGVDASKGFATSIPGITVPDIDAEKLRLEQLLATCIEPRLPRIEIETIPCAGGTSSVLLIRAHRSWQAPHRVTLDDKFYGRNSAGKYPLDVSELRSAFVESETVAEKIRAFRADRIIKIVAGQTPMPVVDRPLIIVHIVPFSIFAGTQAIDPWDAANNGRRVIPQPPGRMWEGVRPIVNLDGFATIAAPSDGKTHAYAQLFRSGGAIEGVTTVGDDGRGTCYILAQTFENTIVQALRNYVDFYKAIDAGMPLFVSLSFIGMSRCYFKTGEAFSTDRPPLSTDIVLLPEATIESEPPNIPGAMRASFDTIWNAYGYEKSNKYDDQGKWIGH